MRNEKEIEEMALAWYRTRPDIMSLAPDVSGRWVPWPIHCAYENGYKQAQKDLFESASEGFEEWFDENFERPAFDYEIETMDQVYSAWVACDLKSQKIIQEKDNEIKRLRELCETYERDLGISEE